MAPDCGVRLGRVLFIIFEFDNDEEWEMIKVWTDKRSNFAEPHKKPALPWPGTGGFILLSDNLNTCIWLSACQVEKISQLNNSWSHIYQRLSQPEATFRKYKHI